MLDHVEHFIGDLLFPLFIFRGEGFDVLRDVGDEVDDVLVALFGIDLEGFFDDVAEWFGEEREVDDTVTESAEDEFIGDDTERVDVRGVGDLARIFFLLGTHVDGSTHQSFFLRDPLFFAIELCNAKIDDFDFARFGDEDVFGLKVAVDDAVGVEVAKGVGDLEDDFKRPFVRERFLLDELAERNALDKLHGDVEPFFPLPLSVEADDVRVICDADDLRFFEEAGGDFFVLEIFGEENFDDERLRGLGMEAEIKGAHAPFIEEAFDFIRADFLR